MMGNAAHINDYIHSAGELTSYGDALVYHALTSRARSMHAIALTQPSDFFIAKESSRRTILYKMELKSILNRLAKTWKTPKAS